jgi:hypothetical protein
VRVHRIVVVLPAAPASPWLRRTAVVSPALSIPRTSRTRLIEAIPPYLTAFSSTRKCSHRSFVAYHRITSELSVNFSFQPSSSSRRRESFRLLRNKWSPAPGSTRDGRNWYGAEAGTEVEECLVRAAR